MTNFYKVLSNHDAAPLYGVERFYKIFNSDLTNIYSKGGCFFMNGGNAPQIQYKIGKETRVSDDFYDQIYICTSVAQLLGWANSNDIVFYEVEPLSKVWESCARGDEVVTKAIRPIREISPAELIKLYIAEEETAKKIKSLQLGPWYNQYLSSNILKNINLPADLSFYFNNSEQGIEFDLYEEFMKNSIIHSDVYMNCYSCKPNIMPGAFKGLTVNGKIKFSDVNNLNIMPMAFDGLSNNNPVSFFSNTKKPYGHSYITERNQYDFSIKELNKGLLFVNGLIQR